MRAAGARPVPLCGSNPHHAEWGENPASAWHRERPAEGGEAEEHDLRLRCDDGDGGGGVFWTSVQSHFSHVVKGD